MFYLGNCTEFDDNGDSLIPEFDYDTTEFAYMLENSEFIGYEDDLEIYEFSNFIFKYNEENDVHYIYFLI